MEKVLNFKKGEDCYDVASKIEDCFNEMINNNFEAVDATLKQKIKVTIKIEWFSRKTKHRETNRKKWNFT